MSVGKRMAEVGVGYTGVSSQRVLKTELFSELGSIEGF